MLRQLGRSSFLRISSVDAVSLDGHAESFLWLVFGAAPLHDADFLGL